MYDTIHELLREISAGEDMRLELKEVLFKGDSPRFTDEETKAVEAIAQVLCSFANAEGGVLVFGVNDNRHITGISPDKMNLLEQWLINVAQHNCEPPVHIIPDRILLPDASGEERLCLKTDIPKSLFVHRTSGGRWVTRLGSHRVDLRPDQLARLMERRRISGPFEERTIPGTTLSDLNLTIFQEYCERRFGPEDVSEGIETEERLVNLKLAERLENGIITPTVLGILLFGRNPVSKSLPGAYADCVCYRGEVADADQQIDAKIFHGPAPEQIVEAVRFVERLSPVAAEKTHEGRRDLPAFSLRAVHEAVVNAIVHRDYQHTGSNVRVFLFADRLEISNPGGLPNSIRPENLYAGCPPYRRNQLLAGFLRDYQSPLTGRALMEARGEGFRMMVRETRRNGGEVEVITHPDGVTIILKSALMAR